MNRTELFKTVRKHIAQVRPQGGKPPVDIEHSTLDEENYSCDLCRKPMGLAGFTQCGLCGRWVCKDECWEQDDSVCITCSGVIKLMRRSFVMAGATGDPSVLESLRKKVADSFTRSEEPPEGPGDSEDQSEQEPDDNL